MSDTGLDDVSHVDLLDLLGLDAGLVERVLDGGDTELGGGEGGEGSIDGSNGGSRSADNVNGLSGLRGVSTAGKGEVYLPFF